MLRRLLEELKFLENEMLCLEQQLALAKQPYQPATAYFYRKAGSGIREAIVATLGGGYFDQLHPERGRNRLPRRLAGC